MSGTSPHCLHIYTLCLLTSHPFPFEYLNNGQYASQIDVTPTRTQPAYPPPPPTLPNTNYGKAFQQKEMSLLLIQFSLTK